MKTTSLITALAATVAATALVVLPASGQGTATTRTLTFVSTQKARDTKFVDVKPKGYSVGDSMLLSSLLHDGGRVAGRIEGHCVLLDPSYHAQMCTITAILAGGTLTLQGAGLDKRLPGVGDGGEVYAITGGTGDYTGAGGTMTRKGNGRRDTLTFTLSQ
jgi:hypothetical protein